MQDKRTWRGKPDEKTSDDRPQYWDEIKHEKQEPRQTAKERMNSISIANEHLNALHALFGIKRKLPDD